MPEQSAVRRRRRARRGCLKAVTCRPAASMPERSTVSTPASAKVDSDTSTLTNRMATAMARVEATRARDWRRVNEGGYYYVG